MTYGVCRDLEIDNSCRVPRSDGLREISLDTTSLSPSGRNERTWFPSFWTCLSEEEWLASDTSERDNKYWSPSPDKDL